MLRSARFMRSAVVSRAIAFCAVALLPLCRVGTQDEVP